MSKQLEKLSIQEARKIILLSQMIPPGAKKGSSVAATLKAMEQIGYVQIDTISVIERAHHHTLWNRNPNYTNSHIDQLLKKGQLFEYWSHAAAYLPMRDYRYSLPRKLAMRSGEQKHWFARDKKLMNSILKRIASEGPLMVKDFENTGRKTKEWESKPAKKALECLFMQGELMVPFRKKFHKVYDLTERCLPKEVDQSVPTPKEHMRFIIKRFLTANGIGQLNEMVYLLKKVKPQVRETLQEMHASGEILEIKIKDSLYYTLPSALKLLDKRLNRNTAKILSPFDNLVIQRQRIKTLFDFDYLLECYVPKPKRKYGYFSLPVLWDGRLLARLDCKADRKDSVLHVFNIVLESKVSKREDFANALAKELSSFMMFNKCRTIKFHEAKPVSFKLLLEKKMVIYL